MINPLPGQPAPVDTATEQWFESIQGPAPEPPKSSRKKHLLIGAAVLLFLAVAGTATALFVSQGPACLNANDYKTLSGSDTTDLLSPTDSFYTDDVLFMAGSNNYDNSTDSGEHGKQLIQKIADFYKTSENKSILITISGNYFSSDAKSVVEDHIGTVKSSLMNAGVPDKIISAQTPVYIEPEDASTTGSETIISVNSASTCK